MNKPVVVLTVYRRPEATRRVLSQILAAHNSDELPVFISCDGARQVEHESACREVQSIVHEWVALRQRRFSTYATYRGGNIGIDLHKIAAIPEALEATDTSGMVFLECDTGIAVDALAYFATNLAATADDPSVLAVCGYNRVPDDNQGPEDAEAEKALAAWQLHGTYRSHAFKPWGWAMNKSVWDRFFGDGGKRYCAEVDNPNGRFDWWLTEQCQSGGMVTVRPYVARTWHSEYAEAEHTPSREFWEANERVSFGAWSVPPSCLPDNGLLGWRKGIE